MDSATLARKRKDAAVRAAKWQAEGKCPKDGKPLQPNKRSCAKCLKVRRMRDAEVYEARKAEGICVKCGYGDPIPPSVYCEECLEQRRLKRKMRGQGEETLGGHS